MLKGHVFKEQIFGNQVFACFVDTFTNKKCGISNYKNKMEITYSGSNVTIQSGLACIRGRFVEEDTYTVLNVGTESYWCKLVIEIDLDKENTEEQLNQLCYKIVRNTSNYPVLTQSNIVENNSGIYQYELARFKTNINGISSFQDMRTYLDFNSIYTEIEKEYKSVLAKLRQELANVEDGSEYILKNNIKSITITINGAFNYINYPDGFNLNNTMVLSIMKDEKGVWNTGEYVRDNSGLFLAPAFATLYPEKIGINAGITGESYKITLMRI